MIYRQRQMMHVIVWREEEIGRIKKIGENSGVIVMFKIMN